MSDEPIRVYEFGPFRLEPGERQLRREGRLVLLTPKAFDTLQALVQSGGRAVSKDELMSSVWPDTNVAEATLAQNIFAVRKALGDANCIETVPKFGYRFVTPVQEVRASARKVILAVLPFENLSRDPEQEYFSDGLTDEMITQLGRLNPQRLGVIARTSAMKYKLTNKTIAEIGRELGVSYVVEGSVRRAGPRVRVTAQLIQVVDQTHVWAESYERRFDDILILQSDIARAIAKEIDVTLTPSEMRRLAGASAISPDAHAAYLKGRYCWNKRTEEGLKKGIEYFHEAIAYEPTFAAAHDGVSDCYVMLACRGVLPVRETFQRARTAARRALELDGALGEGHASLAHVRLHGWDWDGLDDDFRRALELSPAHAIAYYWYAEYLMAVGRADEAIAMVQTAQRMDPLSSVLSASLGMILYLARRHDESIECLGKALDVDPDHFLLHLRLGLVLAHAGSRLEAIDEMKRSVALSGRSTETLTGLAQAYAASGMRQEMQRIVDELSDQTSHRYVSPYNVARVFAAAADAETAFAWLENAYDERNPDLIELRAEPVFDSIRPDPRFADLLRRVGWRG
jgi:TolB-like protein/Tfp pilus assembly protein PilF